MLCNRTYLDFWPRIADRIVPGMRFDEIARLIGDDRAALGAMVSPDRWLSERLAQHSVASGGHVHALADGRWIQVNELRTSEGGIVGIYNDITEVKASDARERARELAQKSVLLQATLDNIRLGVCVYDCRPPADRVESLAARGHRPARRRHPAHRVARRPRRHLCRAQRPDGGW